MFVLRRTTSYAQGVSWRRVVCQHCRTPYVFAMFATASGSEVRPYLFDRQNAADVALSSAQHSLQYEMRKRIDCVPCPACSMYQADMCGQLSKKKFQWMYTTGMFLLVACGSCIFGIAAPFMPSDQSGPPPPLSFAAFSFAAMIVLGALAAATYYLKKASQARFDPNTPGQKEARLAYAATRGATTEAVFRASFPEERIFEREPTGDEVRAGAQLNQSTPLRVISVESTPNEPPELGYWADDSSQDQAAMWRRALCTHCGAVYCFRLDLIPADGIARANSHPHIKARRNTDIRAGTNRQYWHGTRMACMPCPNCSLYQPDMCRAIQERKLGWMKLFGITALVCAGCAIFESIVSQIGEDQRHGDPLTPRELAFVLLMAAVAILSGVLLLVIRNSLLRRPWANSPRRRERRMQITARRALTEADFKTSHPGMVAYERALTGDEIRAAAKANRHHN